MSEIQYPIRGERFTSHLDSYYYLQEHNGVRLGDIVRVERSEREGELVVIVRIMREDEPEGFIGVIRMSGRGGANGYATEYGHMLGLPHYDRNTHGYNFREIVSLYSGPCRGCISKCKTEERCAFYREGAE